MKFEVTVGGRTFDIEVEHGGLVRVNGRPVYVDLEQIGGSAAYSLALDEGSYIVFVEEGPGEYSVEVEGRAYPVRVQAGRPHLERPADAESAAVGGHWALHAPLAGRLVSVPVVAGQAVEAGQFLAVLGSMKMQMELKAAHAGRVEAVHGAPGDEVAQGQILVTLAVE